MNKKICLLNIVIILFCACNTQQKPGSLQERDKIYEPQYAKGFSLYANNKGIILKVTNPWQFASEREFNYILKRNASPAALNEIQIPVTKAVCLSTTHVAFISALGKTSSISGISGLKHVSDSAVIELSRENKILEIGYDTNLSYELLCSLTPDVVFAYGVSGEFEIVEKKLNELGIKVVYLGEYLEDTPLGKAEWIVAVSAFFEERAAAEKIFETMKTNYGNIAKIAENTKHKPLVMMNMPYKDVWYLPGTENYMVKFMEDAGAKYIHKSHNKRESDPMSIEKAFILAQDAEFWLIGNSPKCLDDIKNIDARMTDIPAFKNKKIYNSNLRSNDFGDDFWESGIVKPDIILKDLIKIFHPELLPEHKLYFYRHLE